MIEEIFARNLKKIRDDRLQDEIADLFFSIKPDQNFTFSDNCFNICFHDILFLIV